MTTHDDNKVTIQLTTRQAKMLRALLGHWGMFDLVNGLVWYEGKTVMPGAEECEDFQEVMAQLEKV